jgi:predicted Ser/Thr protein kinase
VSSEFWRRVRDLFERAVDVPASDVDAWLSREEQDPRIVAEVRSLLSHHTGAGTFLEGSITERVPDLIGEDTAFSGGAVIGPYVIEKEIGRGGMGRVYLARDNRLGRRVALKVLPPQLVGDAAQRERLRHEARAAASLTHSGICTIYALEEIDGHVVIVAEYIEGRPLRDEMTPATRRSPRELLDIARELAAALAAAHARGITHRDLKPENIMRTSNGRLKILDFGLALVEPLADDGVTMMRMTSPGTLVGTPLYMAPEQLEGGAVDVRTDLFALGVVLYELATGVHPFEAKSGMALAARILESEPRPIAAIRDDVPRQLAAVIERCLRKRKEDRFASAGDVLLALAAEDLRPAGAASAVWWRNHMAVVLFLYLIAAAAGWQMKEWHRGLASVAFIAIAILATIGGVLRGHLLFAERTHDRSDFLQELRRDGTVLMVVDLIVSALLLAEGLWTAQTRSVFGALIAGLGVGIALARLVLERSTTRAAFGEE